MVLIILSVLRAVRAERSIELSHAPAPSENGFPDLTSSSLADSPTHSSDPVPRWRGTYPSVTWLIGQAEQKSGLGFNRCIPYVDRFL